jgi:hypothetical protein
MAGLSDDADAEDVIGCASFLIAMGRVPGPRRWVQSLVVRAQDEANEAFTESIF